RGQRRRRQRRTCPGGSRRSPPRSGRTRSNGRWSPSDGGSYRSALRQPLDVFREHVGLEVHRVPGLEPRKRRFEERVRDGRDADPALVERCDRERDAVDRERALLDAIAEDLGRNMEQEPCPVAVRLERADAPDAVDVALDVVAAERLAGSQRGLEVDLDALAELRKGCARERLRDSLEGELTVVSADRRQATTGDRDGITEARLGSGLRRGDPEHQGAAVAVQRGGDDTTLLADDAGEHAQRLPRPGRAKSHARVTDTCAFRRYARLGEEAGRTVLRDQEAQPPSASASRVSRATIWSSPRRESLASSA